MNRVEKSRKKFLDFFDSHNHNQEYTLVTPYVSTRDEVKIKHQCGKTLTRTVGNVYKWGFTCRQCYPDVSRRKSKEQYHKEVMSVLGPDYEQLTDYTTNKSKVRFRHLTCMTEYDTRADIPLTMGGRCPTCYLNAPSVREDLSSLISSLDGEFELRSKIDRTADDATFYHKGCGREFTCSPKNFVKLGGYCTACSLTSGELQVRDELDRLSISYKTEYPSIQSPTTATGRLRFDFGILDSNGKLTALIEYDGPQHKQPKFDMTDEDLHQYKQRDAEKDRWAVANGLPLLRIDNKGPEETREYVRSFIKHLED